MKLQKEFEVITLVKTLFENWIKIFIITSIFFIFSIFYSLSIPNTFKASALVVPNPDSFRNEMSGISIQPNSLLSAFSSSGISGNISQAKIGYEILTSRDFLISFILNRDILPNILASENWEEGDELPTYDSNIFDSKNKKFLIEELNGKPLLEEGYKIFKENLMVDNEGIESSLFQISYVSESPIYAKKIVDWIIEDININLSLRDKKKSEKMIEALNDELINVVDIGTREAIFNLTANETRKKTLSNISENYFLMTIDKAHVPYERFSPKRTNMVITYTFLGLFLSSFFFILMKLIKVFVSNREKDSDS